MMFYLFFNEWIMVGVSNDGTDLPLNDDTIVIHSRLWYLHKQAYRNII